jgi:hypothetical protein
MGCYNSCVVDAPVEKVWAKLRDFHDASWAAPVIERLDKVAAAAGESRGSPRRPLRTPRAKMRHAATSA